MSSSLGAKVEFAEQMQSQCEMKAHDYSSLSMHRTLPLLPEQGQICKDVQKMLPGRKNVAITGKVALWI